MQFIGNPRETCAKMYAIMLRLLERICELKDDPKCAGISVFVSLSLDELNWHLLINLMTMKYCTLGFLSCQIRVFVRDFRITCEFVCTLIIR